MEEREKNGNRMGFNSHGEEEESHEVSRLEKEEISRVSLVLEKRINFFVLG